MKKKILNLLSFMLLSSIGFTQNFDWVNIIGGTSGLSGPNEYATALKKDGLGNFYIGGSFGSLNLNFNPAGTGLDVFTAASQGDVFFTKYDASGNYLWTKVFQNEMTAQLNLITDFAFDSDNNIYMIGQFIGYMVMEPSTSSGAHSSGSMAGHDIFVCKFDSNGNYIWSFKLGNADSEYPGKIDIDAANNIYITGGFSGTIDFDPGVGIQIETTTNYAGFVAKYNSNGEFVWVRKFDGTLDDYANSVVVEGNNVYVAGYFYGNCNFDFIGASQILTSNAEEDVFVAKFNTAGDFQYVKQIGGNGNDRPTDIEFNNDKIYTIGYFSGTADFDPSISIENFTSNGQLDIFINILNADDGTYSDTYRFGGTANDVPYGIKFNNEGQFYVTGTFRTTVSFGSTSLTSAGLSDVFVIRIDPFNMFEQPVNWAVSFSGPGTDIATSIEVDENDGIYTVGYFTGVTDFDPGSLIWNGTATPMGSNYDMFFHKLRHCEVLNPVVVATGGGLTVNLSGSPAGVTFQWFDCVAMLPITGATNQNYVPTANGQYAVVINQSTCMEISNCFNVTNANINENGANKIQIYPNPANSNVQIIGDNIQKIIVMDINGKKIDEFDYFQTNLYDVNHLSNGIYIFQIIQNDGKILQEKFIKN